MIVVAFLLAAYLLGSTPTSFLLARYGKGIDLREWGSGNLGATNLYRAAGPVYAAVCMIVDVGKGFVPAWFFPDLDGTGLPQLALAYGIAAVLGHIFSIWVRFRGGKGVATGGGVFLALAPAAAGLAALAWVAVAAVVRIASVASLTAATLLPAFIWVTGHRFDFVFWASLPLVVLVWWTHRSNIRRLAAGREHRVSRGAGGPEPAADSESVRSTGEA
ncbi:MAG: glycerol-3-phosphate 1-O-acyltransferase PlsY [Gemmatimonadota bacterium]|nr:MAG: glycerol-3-phosphate 1-O-acyltransferase PlsY [Gemmatimonadota bacterium]